MRNGQEASEPVIKNYMQGNLHAVHAMIDGLAGAILHILSSDPKKSIETGEFHRALTKTKDNIYKTSLCYTSWQLKNAGITTLASTLITEYKSLAFCTRKTGAYSHKNNVKELVDVVLTLFLNHLIIELPDHRGLLESSWEKIHTHPQVLDIQNSLTNLSSDGSSSTKATPEENKMAFMRDLNREGYTNQEIHINGRNFLTPSMIMGSIYQTFSSKFVDIEPNNYDLLLQASFKTEEGQFHTALEQSVRYVCNGELIRPELTLEKIFNPAEKYLRQILRGASRAALHHGLNVKTLFKKNGITVSDLSHTLTPERQKQCERSPYLTYGFAFDKTTDPVQATLNIAKDVDTSIIEHDLYHSTVERQAIIAQCDNFVHMARHARAEARPASKGLLAEIEDIKDTLSTDENGNLVAPKTLSESEKQSLKETIAKFRALDSRIGKLTRAMTAEAQLITAYMKIKNAEVDTEPDEPNTFSRQAVSVQKKAIHRLWKKFDDYLDKPESPADELEKLYPQLHQIMTRLKHLTEELPNLMDKCKPAANEVREKAKEAPPQLLALSGSIAATFEKLRKDILAELESDNTTSDLSNLIKQFEDLHIKKQKLLTPLSSAKDAEKLILELDKNIENNEAAKILQNTLVRLKGDFDVALGGPSFEAEDTSDESKLLERMDSIFDPLNTRFEESKKNYWALIYAIRGDDKGRLADVTTAIHKVAYREAGSFHREKAAELRKQAPNSPAYTYLADQHDNLGGSFIAASDPDSSEEDTKSSASQGGSHTEEDPNTRAEKLVRLERSILDIQFKTSACDSAIQQILRESESKPNRASNELIAAYESLKSDLVKKLQQDPPDTNIKAESERLETLNKQKKTLLEFIGFYAHSQGQYQALLKTAGNAEAKNQLSDQINYVTHQLNAGIETIAGRSGSLKTFKPIEVGETIERCRTNRTTGIALASTFLPVFSAGAVAAAFFLPAVLTLVGAAAAVAVIAVVGLIVAGVGIYLAHKNRFVRTSKHKQRAKKLDTQRDPSSSVGSEGSTSSPGTTQGAESSDSDDAQAQKQLSGDANGTPPHP